MSYFRLQWLAYLEFAHGNNTTSDLAGLSWEFVDSKLSQSDRLKSMVCTGIPHSLRPQLWLRMSGALQKKEASDSTYADIVKASTCDQIPAASQIEKDLLRTLPTNVCFSQPGAPGIPKLRRILRGVAWLYPQIGLVILMSQITIFLRHGI
jgi:hypothetical protein